MSSERTDTTDRPSHTCSSAEDLVPDWEGCGRAGRCPDPIWLPAVHPPVLSVSKKTKKKKRRAVAAPRAAIAASLAAAGDSAHRGPRFTWRRRRHVRLLALPPPRAAAAPSTPPPASRSRSSENRGPARRRISECRGVLVQLQRSRRPAAPNAAAGPHAAVAISWKPPPKL